MKMSKVIQRAKMQGSGFRDAVIRELIFGDVVPVDGYQLQSISLSDGAYFDTGYYPVPNATDTHCLMTMLNSEEQTRGVFGARLASNENTSYATLFWNIGGNPIFGIGLLGALVSTEIYGINAKIEFHNYSRSRKAIIDENEYTWSVVMSGIRLARSYYIGSFNNNGALYSPCEMKVNDFWNISEWVDGAEVFQRKYVPWLRISDGVACLRDTLTGEFNDAVQGTVTAGEPTIP